MKWIKRIFNRNVYLKFDVPTNPTDDNRVRYVVGVPVFSYEKKIIEIVYTGLLCSSNDEATMHLFMMSKHDGKRGWRLPTIHEAIYCSELSVVKHFSDWIQSELSNWNSLRSPLELVLVRDVTEDEYNYYNGPITRFFKHFAQWTY
jgi:hypothetical protein